MVRNRCLVTLSSAEPPPSLHVIRKAASTMRVTKLYQSPPDEYWYSEELHINLLAKHRDPRTGELTLRVTQLNRNEPAVELFEVPPGYKVVDMTQPESAESR